MSRLPSHRRPMVSAGEADRLRALERLELLDTPPEPEFDALVAAAALVCGAPLSLVSLVDQERQWFKANVGLPGVSETPREVAFCAHAILDDDMLEVRDAAADARFTTNPLVTGEPGIRFYAGVPLRLTDGSKAGTLCVIDRRPRQLTKAQRKVLWHLAVAAVRALESRRLARGQAESEPRFRMLSESSPLGVFATDRSGACTFTNERWQAVHGLSYEEALGSGWSRSLHPADRTDVLGQWRRAAAQGTDFDMEFRLRRPDGSVVRVRANARPVADHDGTIGGLVGTVEDVTERAESLRRLEQDRFRLDGILQGTGAGTWEWNVQTGETRFNERWAEIVGYALDELGPTTIQTWLELAHPDDLARSQALLSAHFAGDSPAYECEARMRHRDGHWVWVLDRGRVMTRTPDGEPEWMFGTHPAGEVSASLRL